MTRVGMMQDMAEELPPDNEVETCELCNQTAGLHNYVEGWFFCLPEHNETALVQRSPNLGKLAKEAQANHDMFVREDAQDGGTEGNYPRRR